MHRIWRPACVALALVLATAAAAEAQLRGLRFPASLQNVFLLRNDAVQKELAVNDEQKALLAELAMQLQQDAFEIFSGLQDLTPEEQKAAIPDVMKMIDEKGQEAQQKVDEILDDTQTERLAQLSLQARGAQALEDKEIVEKLAVTDEQQQKLADIREEANETMQKAIDKVRSGGGDQGELRKQIGELRKRLGDKALTVLTPEQQEQFEKLKGSKFDFPQGRGFPF